MNVSDQYSICLKIVICQLYLNLKKIMYVKTLSIVYYPLMLVTIVKIIIIWPQISHTLLEI